MKRGLLRILLTAVTTLALAGAAVFVLGGFYDLSATKQHPLWIYRKHPASAVVRLP
ncbi:hypothetical protein JSE7799_03602 [Jannaschia seosinensis]|uniref:Uncharacterized protein n=1 Tax=Jannaschia seosinensis TaxID=313367 RepID=A0A0M7BGF9_9RHOB|nr:hypothetical protein [Jannaschia seosinensis]CUH40862.1 hypothetical protein JSE7799_03602 [Jannaschia seosinensis]